MKVFFRIVGVFICLGLWLPASNAIEVRGLTFTVQADTDFPYCCSATPGPAVPGIFVRNDYASHGLSEFNLRFASNGIQPNQFATISFDFVGFYSSRTYGPGFPVTEPSSERIFLNTYRADNLVSVVDYSPREPDRFGGLGSFAVGTYAIGDRITVDATEAFRNAAGSRYPALGISLILDGPNGSFATYDNFVLSVGPIPEPETYALLLSGLAAISVIGRHKKRRSSYSN